MRNWAVLLAAVATSSAFAQKGVGAPRDVPRNHWAFAAVDELFKLRLLDGYPDGSFNGSRPASRYELALALENVDRPTKTRMGSLKQDQNARRPDVEQAELNRQLTDLRKQLDAMQSQRKDLDALDSSMLDLQDQLKQIRKRGAELKRGLRNRSPHAPPNRQANRIKAQ